MAYWIDDKARFNWTTIPVQGKMVSFVAEEVRRERTGMHATVFLCLEDTIEDSKTFLAYDTFNVTRSEDRTRLANKAYRASTNTVKDAYSNETMAHDLDMFCLNLIAQYDSNRFVPEFDDNEALAPLTFAVYPYIVEHGGTIFFGAPGAGKSMTLQAMGIEASAGTSTIWSTSKRPVLYINLERSKNSMMNRHRRLLHALGHTNESANIQYLHVRGYGLQTIAGSVKKFVQQHPQALLILDSLSRAQVGGSLNDDTTANRFTDTMNSFGATWAAIGHAPRNDSTHAFGSIHQDAGADVMVSVSSQVTDSRVGVQLKISKGNDVGHHEPQYFALYFDVDGLVDLKIAQPSEFGELATQEPLSRIQRIELYLQETGASTVGDIARGTDIAQPNVSQVLAQSDKFARTGPPGKGVKYDLSMAVNQ